MANQSDSQRTIIGALLGGTAIALGVAGFFAAQPKTMTPTVAQGPLVPGFDLPRLQGGSVKLSDLRGKIVVIDFWATWCPPCVEGLPKLAAMTAKHKDDGVVFFPINLQEEPDTIKAFLAEKGLTLPIVLDADGKAVKSYKVEPVPQTVFIDRDGVVQLVHIGIGELEKVPEQLKDLIAGKKLAALPNESAERK